jgi:hypothetical protein
MPWVEFYNKFQREMEEHSRDFGRKYDEDLNTTLVFVSLYSCAGVGAFRIVWGPILTMRFRTVWFILSRNVGVHRQLTVGSQAGLRANERQAARDAPQRHHRNYPCQFRALHTSMVRPRSGHRSGSVRFLRDIMCDSPSVIPRHAWEVMAQSVQAERNQWVDRGQEQGAREEAGRDRDLENPSRHGVLATQYSSFSMRWLFWDLRSPDTSGELAVRFRRS